MRVCFDSNCFAVLLDKATTNLISYDGKPISYAKERMESFLESERPEIIIPSTLYAELLMISSLEKQDFDEYLQANDMFILANFDFRAASTLAEYEKPTLGKRLERSDTMAKIKFDRQILATVKTHGVDLIFSTDNGFHIDAKRYGINTRCPSSIELPKSMAQTSLELVINNKPNN